MTAFAGFYTEEWAPSTQDLVERLDVALETAAKAGDDFPWNDRSFFKENVDSGLHEKAIGG